MAKRRTTHPRISRSRDASLQRLWKKLRGMLMQRPQKDRARAEQLQFW